MIGVMDSERELIDSVEAAFATTGAGLSPWPNPHPDGSPRDDEYSRLTDPERWCIIGARLDAWIEVLVDEDVVVVDRDAEVEWVAAPGWSASRSDVLVPRAAGALGLVIVRIKLGHVEDAGVVLGVGNPATEVERFPDCGCDACDSGSQNELDHLDAHLVSIVTGRFRCLRRPGQQIVSLGDRGYGASGIGLPRDINAVLADPIGWDELTGAPWR